MAESRLIWLALLIPLTMGCQRYDGPRRGAVQGAVTLDGNPITAGTIVFTPTGDNKGAVAGGSIRDGRYTIDEPSGPIAGLNAVAISAIKSTGRKLPAPPPSPAGTMIDESVEVVPPRYNVQTELTIEVAAGENTFDFELESK